VVIEDFVVESLGLLDNAWHDEYTVMKQRLKENNKAKCCFVEEVV
jgi:hypothetical protein